LYSKKHEKTKTKSEAWMSILGLVLLDTFFFSFSVIQTNECTNCCYYNKSKLLHLRQGPNCLTSGLHQKKKQTFSTIIFIKVRLMLNLTSILSNTQTHFKKQSLSLERQEGQKAGWVSGWNGSRSAAQLTLLPQSLVAQSCTI